MMGCKKKAKKVLPLVVVTVLSISLGCTAIAVVAAEDFGCACHFDISKNFEISLHHTGAGMKSEYAEEAAAEFGIDMDEYYETWGCANCHASGCEDCHGTYGTQFPHTAIEDPSTNMTTCDKCHFKKQTSTFVGETPKHNQIPIEGPEVHGDRLDCTACHTGWAPTCVNCHLDTRKGTRVVIDDFQLAIGADGKIKPFLEMAATYENETHTGYGEWFAHTTTRDNRLGCRYATRDNKPGFRGQNTPRDNRTAQQKY